MSGSAGAIKVMFVEPPSSLLHAAGAVAALVVALLAGLLLAGPAHAEKAINAATTNGASDTRRR